MNKFKFKCIPMFTYSCSCVGYDYIKHVGALLPYECLYCMYVILLVTKYWYANRNIQPISDAHY